MAMPTLQGSPLYDKTFAMESTGPDTPGGSSRPSINDVERQTSRALFLTKSPEPSSIKDPSAVDRDLPFWHTLGSYLLSEVDTTWCDLPLLCCGYVSGLIDALSYDAWGSFSNMHTGNTIFIALGVSGKPENHHTLWAKALVAVAVFLVGNIFFVYGSRYLGPLRRFTLILSFAIQTGLLLAAALLVQEGLVSPDLDHHLPIDWLQLLVISLIAFQAAGQIVASRFLAFAEIPTVVLTVLVSDLFLDTNLYKRPWSSNPKRNRRLGALLLHFLGAMTAGGMVKQAGLASGLWFAMALKGCITLSWFVWRVKR